MSAPAPARPHRRARTQLLAGLAVLLTVGAAVLVVLGVRLADAREPLSAATATATASVVDSGRPPGGRGIEVRFDDGDDERTGVLVFAEQLTVPEDAQVAVRYDPSSPLEDTAVYADGDTAHEAVQDLVFGLVVVTALLLVATAVTAARLVGRRRLRSAPATDATATRVVVRQGLLVRSWLEMHTARGRRWLPVHWAPEVSALAPGSRIELRGDPDRRRPALPVVDGAEIWPSGRLRDRPPRGEQHAAPADPGASAGWGRQVRVDLAPLLAAPLLGLLWAYVDESGAAGFAVATAVAAAVLFWLLQLLGSDPVPPSRA
jgi:hypothetical protein